MVSKFQISRRETKQLREIKISTARADCQFHKARQTRQTTKRIKMGFNQIAKRSFSLSSTHRNLKDVVIASAARTPMGSFRG